MGKHVMNYDDFHKFEVAGAFFQYNLANLYSNCEGKRGTFISHLTSYKALNFKSNTLHEVLRLHEVNEKAKKRKKKRNINYWKTMYF